MLVFGGVHLNHIHISKVKNPCFGGVKSANDATLEQILEQKHIYSFCWGYTLVNDHIAGWKIPIYPGKL